MREEKGKESSVAVCPPLPNPELHDSAVVASGERAQTERHSHILNVLPFIAALLRDGSHRGKTDRELIHLALDQYQAGGVRNLFWGKDQLYSRKGAVCNAIMLRYLDDIKSNVLR